MGKDYGQCPSTWSGIGDPDLACDYDEAAHFVGTQTERLQQATELVPARKQPKNAPHMVQKSKYDNEQINWVLGFVVDREPLDDGSDTDDLYDRLMAGIDGQPPQA